MKRGPFSDRLACPLHMPEIIVPEIVHFMLTCKDSDSHTLLHLSSTHSSFLLFKLQIHVIVPLDLKFRRCNLFAAPKPIGNSFHKYPNKMHVEVAWNLHGYYGGRLDWSCE